VSVPDDLTALILHRAGTDRPVCLYAYDLDALAAHVQRVVAALPVRCRMFYAMKANSAAPLLRTMAPLVDGFEVASGGEVAKARAAHPTIPVFFGGPAKTPSDIGPPRPARAPPADGGPLGAGVRPGLRGPQRRWRIGIEYADRGNRFDWKYFARGLHRLVDSIPAHCREIDFECGRFLVAECGSYAVEVLDTKRNHGVSYVVVRGGTHHFRLPVSWQHSHPLTVVPVERWPTDCPRPELRGEPVTVVGELCTPKDVLARDVVLDRVRAGDVLAFSHAGAYGWEISHHDFLSHPHPERVFLGDGTPPEVVARADRGRAGHAAALDPAPEAPAR
jgi:diaminopimelate decarboxylase